VTPARTMWPSPASRVVGPVWLWRSKALFLEAERRNAREESSLRESLGAVAAG
jgi:hypothetical protein